jgi:hypothetical protein
VASLKKDAPPEIVAAIEAIESRADQCFQHLALLHRDPDLAIWGVLVGGIDIVEQQITQHGDNSQELSIALTNLSRSIPTAIKWARTHSKPGPAPTPRAWDKSLFLTVKQALDVAAQYNYFESCFPMWHRERYLAELRSPNLVRFTAPGNYRNRQVSAYLKGMRPNEGSFKGVRAERPKPSLIVEALFDLVLRGAFMTGFQSFRYDDPWTLWRELLPEYQGRVNAIGRRSGALHLGTYTLEQFRQFYAAFLAICAAHEHLCYTWRRNNNEIYPNESGVLVRTDQKWVRVMSQLSGLRESICRDVITDLSFDFTHSIDMHISPFVPLSDSTLAVAPPFPLHSHWEENILRICSARRPGAFDATSLRKEPDFLAEVKARLSGRNPLGPFKMPKPTPDIDLLIADDDSSTIVIAEVKWMRKTLLPREFAWKDAEVLKGISQLQEIRQFLLARPDHFSKQKRLPRPMTDYQHIHYLLIPRDHWPWAEPTPDIAMVEFDAFMKCMSQPATLHEAVTDLLRYEWLPVEGRDFTVRYERSFANGVSIESETFYLLHPE